MEFSAWFAGCPFTFTIILISSMQMPDAEGLIDEFYGKYNRSNIKEGCSNNFWQFSYKNWRGSCIGNGLKICNNNVQYHRTMTNRLRYRKWGYVSLAYYLNSTKDGSTFGYLQMNHHCNQIDYILCSKQMEKLYGELQKTAGYWLGIINY